MNDEIHDKLTRLPKIDLIKTIAVFIMIFEHSYLMMNNHFEARSHSIDAIFYLSRFCAPAFVICYAYSISRQVDIAKTWLRIRRLLLGSVILSSILHFLSVGIFNIHILYSFILVTLLVNQLNKLDSKLLLALIILAYWIILVFNFTYPGIRALSSILIQGTIYDVVNVSYGILLVVLWSSIGVALVKFTKKMQPSNIKYLILVVFSFGGSTFYIEYLVSSQVFIHYSVGLDILCVTLVFVILRQTRVRYAPEIVTFVGKNVLSIYIVHHAVLLLIIKVLHIEVNYNALTMPITLILITPFERIMIFTLVVMSTLIIVWFQNISIFKLSSAHYPEAHRSKISNNSLDR